jgi:hypothetical protein
VGHDSAVVKFAAEVSKAGGGRSGTTARRTPTATWRPPRTAAWRDSYEDCGVASSEGCGSADSESEALRTAAWRRSSDDGGSKDGGVETQL